MNPAIGRELNKDEAAVKKAAVEAKAAKEGLDLKKLQGGVQGALAGVGKKVDDATAGRMSQKGRNVGKDGEFADVKPKVFDDKN